MCLKRHVNLNLTNLQNVLLKVFDTGKFVKKNHLNNCDHQIKLKRIKKKVLSLKTKICLMIDNTKIEETKLNQREFHFLCKNILD